MIHSASNDFSLYFEVSGTNRRADGRADVRTTCVNIVIN